MASCGKASFLLSILVESEIVHNMIDFVNFLRCFCVAHAQNFQNIVLNTSSSWLLTWIWIQWAAVVV